MYNLKILISDIIYMLMNAKWALTFIPLTNIIIIAILI